MSKGAWITLGVLVVAVLGGMGVYKFTQHQKFDDEARELARASIRNTVGLQEHAGYVGPLTVEYHPQAFEAGFDLGGLRSQASFDEEVYLDELWKLIEARARADGREDVVRVLPRFAHHRDETARGVMYDHPVWGTPLPLDEESGLPIQPTAEEIAEARINWWAQRRAGIEEPSADWVPPEEEAEEGQSESEPDAEEAGSG